MQIFEIIIIKKKIYWVADKKAQIYFYDYKICKKLISPEIVLITNKPKVKYIYMGQASVSVGYWIKPQPSIMSSRVSVLLNYFIIVYLFQALDLMDLGQGY